MSGLLEDAIEKWIATLDRIARAIETSNKLRALEMDRADEARREAKKRQPAPEGAERDSHE